MTAAQEQQGDRRRRIAAVAPILVGLVVFAAVFAVRSQADDRHQHTVVLLSQNDGFLSAWDNRNQAAELLTPSAKTASRGNIVADLEVRFSSSLAVVVTAADATTAATVAEQLAAEAVAERRANTEARWRSAAEGHRAARSDIEGQISDLETQIDSAAGEDARSSLERDLASLNESRLSLDRQIADAEADLASAVVPLAIASSTPDGLVGPKPLRDAAIAATVAVLALAVLRASVRPTALRE